MVSLPAREPREDCRFVVTNQKFTCTRVINSRPSSGAPIHSWCRLSSTLSASTDQRTYGDQFEISVPNPIL